MSDLYMAYIPTQQQSEGARKYVGPVAQGYDEKREKSEKWTVEQNVIEGMLDDLPTGHWVLDVPCGTGRFFDFYHKKGFCFRAVDASADMLVIAANKVADPMKAHLRQGDIRALPIDDKSVDASVMCRLTRWLSPEDCQVALKELQRVTRDRIIVTARMDGPHARPVDIFLNALEDDWEMAENAEGYCPEYRILQFRHKKVD